ncbi:MAG: type II secretion system major pseudopilin GspG [Deltaproteobacteria bacterium]|nr:type II secretion system major pseudopilin GspG [Deltaproteobacteria bacterium]
MFNHHLQQLLHRLLTRERRPARGVVERGMTLVEVMVVVVIISLVASVVSVAVLNRLEEARKKLAFTQIKQIGEALELYKLSLRHYPTTGEGLQALVSPRGNERPFMNSIPQDPWGNDYVYIYPGSNTPSAFDLMSYGPDGVQGGGDDVTSWQSLDANKQEQ